MNLSLLVLQFFGGSLMSGATLSPFWVFWPFEFWVAVVQCVLWWYSVICCLGFSPLTGLFFLSKFLPSCKPSELTTFSKHKFHILLSLIYDMQSEKFHLLPLPLSITEDLNSKKIEQHIEMCRVFYIFLWCFLSKLFKSKYLRLFCF